MPWKASAPVSQRQPLQLNMLPKVSFTDMKSQNNGTECFSRGGKMTNFNYPIFKANDPIATHEKTMKLIYKEQ